MAEFGHSGLLAALLLFSALTLRDMYMGKEDVVTPEREETRELRRQPAAPLYTGPALRFQYWRVFEEYSRAIRQLYPDIHIEGDNYPPKPILRHIATFLSCLKFVALALILTGQNPFPLFGVDTPRIWTWSQENKIFSCLMTFFLSNMLESQCLSTGAFEITLNDVPIWSKLEVGFVPNLQELFQILENQMKMNPMETPAFRTP